MQRMPMGVLHSATRAPFRERPVAAFYGGAKGKLQKDWLNCVDMLSEGGIVFAKWRVFALLDKAPGSPEPGDGTRNSINRAHVYQGILKKMHYSSNLFTPAMYQIEKGRYHVL